MSFHRSRSAWQIIRTGANVSSRWQSSESAWRKIWRKRRQKDDTLTVWQWLQHHEHLPVEPITFHCMQCSVLPMKPNGTNSISDSYFMLILFKIGKQKKKGKIYFLFFKWMVFRERPKSTEKITVTWHFHAHEWRREKEEINTTTK